MIKMKFQINEATVILSALFKTKISLLFSSLNLLYLSELVPLILLHVHASLKSAIKKNSIFSLNNAT